MPGATGQAVGHAIDVMKGQTPEQLEAGVMRNVETSPIGGSPGGGFYHTSQGQVGNEGMGAPPGTGGPIRFDAVDAAEEGGRAEATSWARPISRLGSTSG